ncbi:MAG: twin-arginine translocation signal domain-containing protein, partial [Verrucomicrobia bacterium]|nr:twin-arginine translocation signal domain-containing protein [Verrucomicrobiota bacterium]
MKPLSTRRNFLKLAAMTAAAGPVLSHAASPSSKRKRIALIATEMRLHSHGQHFIDRFLLGYQWRGVWRKPDVDLVSLYIDQFPAKDLARAASKRYGVPIFPTVSEALTLGTSKLAVDGVVIIAEHGDYPRNEKGQTLYPRYKFFKECVRVFESSGRSVPIFNDKHLSTQWHECVEMVEDSRRLGFPFQAGSSLPVTRRLPAIDLPHGWPLSESVCAAYGGMDSYDIHGLETAQCMSERRRGGETGIRRVLALRGAAMWEHVAGRETTRALLESALTRSHNLPVVDGYPSNVVNFEWARSVFPDGWAYFIDHRDGFRTTLFMLPIRDFNYAGMNART